MNKTMKIAIIIGIILLFLTGIVVGGYFYVSRDVEEIVTPSPPVQVTAPEVSQAVELTPEPSQPVVESGESGVIEGDILFNGVALSRLSVEPFKDVLGEPLTEDGDIAYYDGFFVTWDDTDGYPDLAISIVAFAPDLGMFELNDISFDSMTQTDVIAVFGAPYSSYDYGSISYRVSNPVINYSLNFMFARSDNTVETLVINIIRFGDEGAW